VIITKHSFNAKPCLSSKNQAHQNRAPFHKKKVEKINWSNIRYKKISTIECSNKAFQGATLKKIERTCEQTSIWK
jgi:hypothetical protein